MAEITSDIVKELREKTGCGMMDCKKALVDTNGDMEKAVEFLRKKGLASASKKADRTAAQGTISAVIDKNIGVLFELNCETDFVASNPDFQVLVKDLALQVAQKNPKDKEDLLSQAYIKDSAKKVDEVIKETIAKFGENTLIGNFTRYEASSSHIESYIHLNGKIGVLVEVSADKTELVSSQDLKTLARDVALQVAASKPVYLNRSEVPQDILDKEKEILKAQALAEGKPEKIIDKMVEGRLNKYYQDFCLVDQAFVKDPAKKIEDIIKETSSKLNGNISVKRFTRFQIGS